MKSVEIYAAGLTFRVVLPVVLLLLFVTFSPLVALSPKTAWIDSPYIQDCAACHEQLTPAFESNPHIILDTKEIAKEANAEFSCASCHGDVSKHIEAGGGTGNIFAFGAEQLVTVKNEKCQTCHSTVHPRFAASPHGKDGMDCIACHSIHKSKAQPLLVENEKALCSQCHEIVASKFKLNNHHRLPEGIVQCTSCHDPHEPQTIEQLGGFKQEKCFTCHTDKQGPFIFEHASVRVEGCVACHDPHGSVNRHMLHFQSVASLCYSCHASVPSFHARFTVETQCTHCHVAIHGSNLSAFFLQ